jgi:hypothetical protein
VPKIRSGHQNYHKKETIKMSKKLVVLITIMLIALVVVSPVFAAGNGRGRGGKSGGSDQQFFSVLGTITDIGSDTITIDVLEGSKVIWAYIGGELTVNLTGSTTYYEWTPDGRIAIAFEDVAVGDITNIQGTLVADVFTATRVTVDVECPQ